MNISEKEGADDSEAYKRWMQKQVLLAIEPSAPHWVSREAEFTRDAWGREGK